MFWYNFFSKVGFKINTRFLLLMLSDSGRRSEVSLFVCLSSVSAAESWDSFQSDSNLAGLDSLSAGNFLSTKSIQTDCYGLPVWDQFSDSSAWHMYRKHTSSATPRHLQRSIFYFWFWSLFIKIRHNWLEHLERWSCREHDIDYPEQLVILWHRRQCWWWSLISGHRTNIAQRQCPAALSLHNLAPVTIPSQYQTIIYHQQRLLRWENWKNITFVTIGSWSWHSLYWGLSGRIVDQTDVWTRFVLDRVTNRISSPLQK